MAGACWPAATAVGTPAGMATPFLMPSPAWGGAAVRSSPPGTRLLEHGYLAPSVLPTDSCTRRMSAACVLSNSCLSREARSRKLSATAGLRAARDSQAAHRQPWIGVGHRERLKPVRCFIISNVTSEKTQ